MFLEFIKIHKAFGIHSYVSLELDLRKAFVKLIKSGFGTLWYWKQVMILGFQN